MRKMIKTLLALLFVINCTNAQSTKTVKTNVDKAIVYLAGASLSSTEDFILKPGINELIFEGVAPGLDKNSLQASGKGNFVIMDVKYNVKYNEKLPPIKANTLYLKSMKQFNDTLVELEFSIDELNDKLISLASEKSILLNNRLIKGETKQDTLDLFKDALAYLRMRIDNINDETYKAKRKLFRYNESKLSIQQKIQELEAFKNSEDHQTPINPIVANQIIVTVMAENEINGRVTISYFVNNAGWKPSYDVRAVSTSNNLVITQKAHLFQNTDIDWKDATLTFSTGTPNQSTTKPNLNPMFLSFYNAYESVSSNRMREMIISDKKTGKERDEKFSIQNEEKAKDISDFTVMVENLIQTEYSVKLKYSIPSDGKEHLILIQNKEIKAEYNFSAVPKMDANAFLIAKITNWEELNLIPGESRIFFDGSYLGASFIDPNIANDTLTLSLGKDKSIVMSRKKLKDKTKERFIVDQKTLTYSFEITLKNTKPLVVQINLEDQIPVSKEKDVLVKLVESNKANYNSENGKLLWDISLKPNETKKILVTYEILLPKDKNLAGL